MQLRACKGLIRFVILLISFQFLSSSIIMDEGSTVSAHDQSFHAQYQKSISLSVFFEENKTERETEGEEDPYLHCFEIADLSYISQILTEIHTHCVPVLPIEHLYDLKPPLFKLHRTYII